MAIGCGQRRWHHHLAELARILSSGRQAAAGRIVEMGGVGGNVGCRGGGSTLGWGLVINGGAAHHGLWRMAIGGANVGGIMIWLG